jgi:hypothetical protein
MLEIKGWQTLAINLNEQDPRIRKSGEEGKQGRRDNPIETVGAEDQEHNASHHKGECCHLAEHDVADEFAAILRLHLAQSIELDDGPQDPTMWVEDARRGTTGLSDYPRRP